MLTLLRTLLRPVFLISGSSLFAFLLAACEGSPTPTTIDSTPLPAQEPQSTAEVTWATTQATSPFGLVSLQTSSGDGFKVGYPDNWKLKPEGNNACVYDAGAPTTAMYGASLTQAVTSIPITGCRDIASISNETKNLSSRN